MMSEKTTGKEPITISWTREIRPKTGWFDLHLSEIWRYRDLILLLVRRDFVAQFKQTILGPAWFVLQPLMATVVFTVVFKKIANLPTDTLPAGLFYLSGNVIWLYFSDCFKATSETFVTNAAIFGKVYFPRLVVPISIVISHMLKFFLQLFFFLGFCLLYFVRGVSLETHYSLAIWLLPLLLFIMAMQGLGLGIIFSAMTTKYRDLRFLIGFGVQLLMYATPVILPLSQATGKYRLVFLLNPMTPVIEAFRYAFLGQGILNASYLLYSATFGVVALFLGILFFSRIERTFMDTV